VPHPYLAVQVRYLQSNQLYYLVLGIAAALITGPKIKWVISTGEKTNGHFVDLPAPAGRPKPAAGFSVSCLNPI
jgi:hypothetical protein